MLRAQSQPNEVSDRAGQCSEQGVLEGPRKGSPLRSEASCQAESSIVGVQSCLGDTRPGLFSPCDPYKNPMRTSWGAVLWGALYLGMLAAVAFLPGASLLDRLRWLTSGICAQLATHSFYPGGERLPLCARNTGIYLGFMVTLLTLYATGRGRVQRFPSWPIIILLLCGVCAMGVDGFNSFLLDLGLPHLYQPHNLLRLATGLVTGLALATLTLPAINHLFWREYSEKRSISSWLALLLLLPGLLLSFFAVASQSALILYPVALLSTAGILTAVSSVNLIVVLAISKRDQAFERYRELLPFFSLALVLAIGEMLVLAQLKFSLLQALGM